MRLINKLKRLVGIEIAQYDILYTNPLTQSQRMQLATKMINKFSGNCHPNRISVSQQTATVETSTSCLTGSQLKKISDDTVGQPVADISYIRLNGDIIWSKN